MELHEFILTICTIIISIIALFYSIKQTKLNQLHNRLSVKPILDYSVLISTSYNRFSVIIENNGLGPAVISNFRLFIDNMSFFDLKEIHNIEDYGNLSIFLDYQENKLDWHHISTGNVINVGQKIEIVGFKYDKYSNENSTKFRNMVNRIKFEVKYSSIYEIDSYTLTFKDYL